MTNNKQMTPQQAYVAARADAPAGTSLELTHPDLIAKQRPEFPPTAFISISEQSGTYNRECLMCQRFSARGIGALHCPGALDLYKRIVSDSPKLNFDENLWKRDENHTVRCQERGKPIGSSIYDRED